MFSRARITLTTWYLVIIMAISVGFSAVIYTGISREVERFARGQRAYIQRRMQENMFFQPSEIYFINPDLVHETQKRVLLLLTLINSGILIFAGGLGYILAGRTLKPIADMLEEQNRFISDASHELKTPLTSLKSAFEVHLRNKKRTLKESDTVISESIDEVNKLQQLSESLLTLATPKKSTGNSSMEIVPVSDCISQAIKKVAPLAKSKKISIKNSQTDALIQAHKDQIIELMIILLDNAIKYSDKGTVIAISTNEKEKKIHISVLDHGIGIDEKHVSRIFDRFWQEDAARSKTRGGGFGLGLSIAKTITQSHNGTISVTSQKGRGSTFTVSLPKFSKLSDNKSNIQ